MICRQVSPFLARDYTDSCLPCSFICTLFLYFAGGSEGDLSPGVPLPGPGLHRQLPSLLLSVRYSYILQVEVRVICRQVSPFLPRDYTDSCLPCYYLYATLIFCRWE